MDKLDSQQFYFILGESMRRARKKAGISKERVARALAVSLPKYISMEEGLEEIPANELYIFTQMANTSVDELFAPFYK